MTTTIPHTDVEPSRVPATGRIQLALNVSNMDEAIAFYTKLFGAAPAKIRPGYANFAIANPPLKLVLIESGDGGTINHLGVEVGTTDEVEAADARIHGAGLATSAEMATECCYAVQDKIWIDAPDALKWEVYTVLGDSQQFAAQPADSCC